MSFSSKNRILILFLFLNIFIFKVFAEPFDSNDFKLFKNINSKIENDCNPSKGNEIKSENDLFQSCVVSLCGPANEVETAFITDKNFMKNLTPELKNKIESFNPLIAEMKNVLIEQNKKIVSDFENNFNNFESKDLDEEMRFRLTDKFYISNLEILIDPNKDIKDRVQILVNAPEDWAPAEKNDLAKFAEDYKKYLLNNPDEYIAKNIYTPEEVNVLAKKRLNDFLNYYYKNKKQFQKAQVNYIEKEISELSKNFISGPLELNDRVQKLENVAYGKIELPVHQFHDFPVCNESKCMELMRRMIKDPLIKNKMQVYGNKLKDKKFLNKIENTCKSQLTANVMDSVDNEILNKNFINAKNALIKNVLLKFSKESSEKIINYINKKLTINQKKEKSNEYVFDNFKQAILKFNKNSMNTLNSAKTILSIIEEDLGEIPLIVNSPCSDTFYSQNSIVNHIDNKNFKGPSSPSTISLSNFACSNDYLGNSLIAHELGHVLNYIFVKEKISFNSGKIYQSLRDCASSIYSEKSFGKDYLARSTDKRTTEEDTADLISFMAYPQNEKLYTCSQIPPSFDEFHYAGLKMIDEQEMDSHSEMLFRLLNEAINKSVTLGSSCKKVLENYKKIVDIKKCIL